MLVEMLRKPAGFVSSRAMLSSKLAIAASALVMGAATAFGTIRIEDGETTLSFPFLPFAFHEHTELTGWPVLWTWVLVVAVIHGLAGAGAGSWWMQRGIDWSRAAPEARLEIEPQVARQSLPARLFLLSALVWSVPLLGWWIALTVAFPDDCHARIWQYQHQHEPRFFLPLLALLCWSQLANYNAVTTGTSPRPASPARTEIKP